MFENYFKIDTPNIKVNDSALIKCLRFSDENVTLFSNWIAKELNLPSNDEKVKEKLDFILEQRKKFIGLPYNEKNQLLDYLARLLSAKFSGNKQANLAISLTIDKLLYAFTNKKPIIFIFGFGGYKNYNSPSFPEVDMAELFHMKYMTTFLWPIITTYKYGVKFEYESEEISIQFNNVPQKTTDRYTQTFQALLKYFVNQIYKANGIKLDFNFIIARELYNPSDLYDKMKDYYNEMKETYNNLPEGEKQIWFKRAKTNFLIKGETDYSKLSENDIEKLIIDARINNECFLAADYELRIDFWERPNAISLFGTWGKSPCASPTDGGLHLKSTASSNTDFWIGTGVLFIDKNNKIIQEQILSQTQYAEKENSIFTIKNTDNDLSSISKNFENLKCIIN